MKTLSHVLQNMFRDPFRGTDSSFVADAEQKLEQHRIFRVSQSAGILKKPAAEKLRELLLVDFHKSVDAVGSFMPIISEQITVCLTTAASRSSLEDWTEFAGSCMTELAFTDELKDDEAYMLHSLQCLLHSVPELWITCGRACAALAAIDKNTFSEYEDSFPAEP